LSEENPLLNLPRPIVEALFKSAEVEALRVKQRVLKLVKDAERFKPLLRFMKVEVREPPRVVAVDGSMSPTSSSRLGSEFAIYTAGYMVFEGRRVMDERYYAGSMSWVEGAKTFRTLLRLMMAYAERKAALEAYRDYDPDYVLLDGPFFYFRGMCRYLRSVELDLEEASTGLELVRKVRDMTLELINTGRAVCVIRRSVMRAIDGWLLYHQGEDACVKARDKHLLTLLMPSMSSWSYDQLLDRDPVLYAAFYRYYRYRRQQGVPREVLEEAREALMEHVERDFKCKLKEDLDVKTEQLPPTQRVYIRYSSNMPPFEVEAPRGFDVKGFASSFACFYNEATGLPFPVDLIDSAVSLPRGSTTAFTEEVEARLVRDSSIEGKSAISDYFSYLNPQKSEQV